MEHLQNLGKNAADVPKRRKSHNGFPFKRGGHSGILRLAIRKKETKSNNSKWLPVRPQTAACNERNRAPGHQDQYSKLHTERTREHRQHKEKDRWEAKKIANDNDDDEAT